ncbi:hypothetical protein [Streptomyces sp. YGL11-2]|uniref:hypothetical protein n=1 Tax=Streptomyces sp. YGL11-2 TaxID=3414028 RepID=UPI003CF5B05F
MSEGLPAPGVFVEQLPGGVRTAGELGTFQAETVRQASGLTLEQDVVEICQVPATGELLVREQPGARRHGKEHHV